MALHSSGQLAAAQQRSRVQIHSRSTARLPELVTAPGHCASAKTALGEQSEADGEPNNRMPENDMETAECRSRKKERNQSVQTRLPGSPNGDCADPNERADRENAALNKELEQRIVRF